VSAQVQCSVSGEAICVGCCEAKELGLLEMLGAVRVIIPTVAVWISHVTTVSRVLDTIAPRQITALH
jgi:hypothetical protein